MLGRKIKISFFFKSAKLLGPFLTLLQSQKSTKAAALVALVVMTLLLQIMVLLQPLKKPGVNKYPEKPEKWPNIKVRYNSCQRCNYHSA